MQMIKLSVVVILICGLN